MCISTQKVIYRKPVKAPAPISHHIHSYAGFFFFDDMQQAKYRVNLHVDGELQLALSIINSRLQSLDVKNIYLSL